MHYFLSLWILYFCLIFIGLTGCTSPQDQAREFVEDAVEDAELLIADTEDEVENLLDNFDMPPSDNFEPVEIGSDDDIIDWLDEVAEQVGLDEEAAPAPIDQLLEEVAPEIDEPATEPEPTPAPSFPPHPIEVCPQGFMITQESVECLPTCERAAQLAGYSQYTLYVDKTDAVIQRWSNRAIYTCDKLNRWDSSWMWGRQGSGWQEHRDWLPFEYYHPVYDQMMTNDDVYEVQEVRHRERGMTKWYSVCCVR